MNHIKMQSLLLGMILAFTLTFLAGAAQEGGSKVPVETTKPGEIESFGFGVPKDGFAVVKDAQGYLYVVDTNGYSRRVVHNPSKDRKKMKMDTHLKAH